MRVMVAALIIVCVCSYSAQAKIYQCFKGSQIIYQDRPCGKGTDEWNLIDDKGDPISHDKPQSSSSKPNRSSPSAANSQVSTFQSMTTMGNDWGFKELFSYSGDMTLDQVSNMLPQAEEGSGEVDMKSIFAPELLKIDHLKFNNETYRLGLYFYMTNDALSLMTIATEWSTDMATIERIFHKNLQDFRQELGAEIDHRKEDWGKIGSEDIFIWDTANGNISVTFSISDASVIDTSAQKEALCVIRFQLSN